jgi:RNA polymerase sigma factor (sigma-70 family)
MGPQWQTRSLESVDDRALLRLFVESGSLPLREAAFAELVARHRELVHRVCRRNLHGLDLADDATQLVFIALARRAPVLGNDVRVRGWLYRAAKHVAADLRKQESRRARRHEVLASFHTHEPSLESEPIEWQVDEMIGELPASERRAIRLRYLEGRSVGEVADTLGLSYDGAKKRVARALVRMRTSFAPRPLLLPAIAAVFGFLRKPPIAKAASFVRTALTGSVARLTVARVATTSAVIVAATLCSRELKTTVHSFAHSQAVPATQPLVLPARTNATVVGSTATVPAQPASVRHEGPHPAPVDEAYVSLPRRTSPVAVSSVSNFTEAPVAASRVNPAWTWQSPVALPPVVVRKPAPKNETITIVASAATPATENDTARATVGVASVPTTPPPSPPPHPLPALFSDADGGSGFVRVGMFALPGHGLFAFGTAGNVTGTFEAMSPHELVPSNSGTGGGAMFTAGVGIAGATNEKITLQQFALGDGSIESSTGTFKLPGAVTWEGCPPESAMLASASPPSLEIGSSFAALPSTMSALESQFTPTANIPEPSALMWLPLLAIPLARSRRRRRCRISAHWLDASPLGV